MPDMLGIIFYEQRSMATKWGKQAIRKADARKIGFLETPSCQGMAPISTLRQRNKLKTIFDSSNFNVISRLVLSNNSYYLMHNTTIGHTPKNATF